MGSLKCDVCLREGAPLADSQLITPLLHKHLGILVFDQLLSCDSCRQLVQVWDEFSQQARFNLSVTHPNAQHHQLAYQPPEEKLVDPLSEDDKVLPTDAGVFECTLSCADTASAAAVWSELEAKEGGEFVQLEDHHMENNADTKHGLQVDIANHLGVYTEELEQKVKPSRQSINTPHICTHCSKKFLYEKSLDLHVQNCHPVGGLHVFQHSETKASPKLSCPICNGCLSTQFQMNQHIRLCHPDTETEKKNCKANPKYLLQSEYVCEICNADLCSKQKLEFHIKYEHGNSSIEKKIKFRKNPKKCYTCNRTFSCRSVLLSHQAAFHNLNTNTSSYQYSCKLCSRSFDRKLSLVTHLRFHPEMLAKNNSSPNNKMSATSTTGNNVSPSHQKYTKQASSFVCKLCTHSAESESAIQDHVANHHGSTSQSNKPTQQIKELSINLYKIDQISKTTNNFVLPKCPEQQSSSLKDFSRMEGGRYKCKLCRKILSSSHGIDYHMYKHILGNHKAVVNHYIKKGSNYICKICKKCLNTSSGIQYHIRHAHLKIGES